MKTCFLFHLYLIVLLFSAKAQNTWPTSIQTEKGVMKISKTNNGKDMIRMSIASWDEMVAGTKYIAYYLSSKGKILCMEIADKQTGLCKKGIGFGCSIFDCPHVPDPLPNKVNDENRICAVSVKKIKGVVQIIFIDHVDWKSLE
jgi:hypothetical protein